MGCTRWRRSPSPSDAAGHPRIGDGLLRLNRTCVRLVEGQYLDLAMESAADATFEQYEQMVARKTAALIECSAALGAWAAGATDEQIDAAGRFGYELGIAFQFQDDLLGVWGDPKVTGKPARDDVRSRKKALPMMLALAAGRRRGARRDPRGSARAEPHQTTRAVDRVVTLMEQIGVREQAAEMVQDRFARLEQAVGEALPAGQDGPIRELCARLRVRDY